ncbi:MAG: DNA polymerase III subunit delta' [Parvularculaceae bacterium]|nr:DNA polymerase III subunit delta' [Parvularculaceae bacterium]
MEPRERENQIGREALERKIAAQIREGALGHGWLVVGGPGAGKATLACRIARVLLDPEARRGDALDMPSDARAFRLVAQGAHPDLFVAERRVDAKTEKVSADIAVETIRELIGFMNRTAAFGGWRVAIVDTADDLNRNSANALLKILEEPPPRSTLLLLTAAPGRLLPTIRSRCRRIDLAAVAESEIAAFVEREAGVDAETAARVAAASDGRPGYALALATGEGPDAVAAVDAFLATAAQGGDFGGVAAALSGKAGDARWEIFRALVVERLAGAARAKAAGAPGRDLDRAPAPALVRAYHQLSELLARGEGLNADRSQLVFAAGRILTRVLREAA